MVDKNFYKKDKQYYDEWLHLKSSEVKEQLGYEYRYLKRKAVKLLNNSLHNQGHEGRIMMSDVADDEIWKYLRGEEKELFNKYSRFLDFEVGFKPHTENHKIKRFKDILNESKLVKEGLRFNTSFLRLPEGEYNIFELLNEVKDLRSDLDQWIQDGWNIVATIGCDNEIIPMDGNNNFKKLKK